MILCDYITLAAYVAAMILLPLYGILVLMKKGKRNERLQVR
jgi:hypothetical protein